MEQHTLRVVVRRLVIGFAVLCALAAAAPAAAQVADEDGDGVADEVDQCTETPAGDFVDPTGCSVCPCDETAAGDPWASHDDYVACVAAEAKSRRADHILKKHAMKLAIQRARKATCGNEALTRCCIYAHLDDDAEVTVGQCKVMTPDACDALSDRDDLDYVEDADAGSCTPNPCLF